MPTAKKQILNMINQLPENATWDHIIYGVYVQKKIAAGIKAAYEGRVVSHERVKEFCSLTPEVRRAMKQRAICEKTILPDLEKTRKSRS